MKNELKFNRDEFLFKMINQFTNKDQEGIRRIYRGYINLLEQDAKTDLKNGIKHDYSLDEKKRKILEKCLEMFTNSETRSMIANGKLTPKQIFDISRERILGDGKRKYNMSDLNDPSVIENKQGGIKATEKHAVEHFFEGFSGDRMKIQPVGEINYKNAVGTEKYVTKYIVTRETIGNKEETFEVYSNINLILMDQSDEYREIVLNELLSKNNIELSNANGYIGEIEEDHDMDFGEEDKKEGSYKYKASPNYMLTYDSEDLSAVTTYEKDRQKGEER